RGPGPVGAGAHQWVIGICNAMDPNKGRPTTSDRQNGILGIQIAIKRSHPQGFYTRKCEFSLSKERALRYGAREWSQWRTTTDCKRSSSYAN
ncbi:hypothetical protein, partial [Xanthomonas perforans]|uniref:hypothetical protein n=1 Tax=Xanthomonas perforans TaxID=442694 RepID=UPI001F44FF89